MSEVKRYDTFPAREVLHESPSGRVVLYEDYAALQSENERLREALRKISAQRKMCVAGSSETVTASQEIKKAFRDGSNVAFVECADIADAALARHKLDKEI